MCKKIDTTGAQHYIEWHTETVNVWVKDNVWVMSLEKCGICGDLEVVVAHWESDLAFRLLVALSDMTNRPAWVQAQLFNNE